MAESERIDRPADRLIAAIPKLEPRDQKVAVVLTRMCWPKGEPVSEQALATALGVRESRIREPASCCNSHARDRRERGNDRLTPDPAAAGKPWFRSAPSIRRSTIRAPLRAESRRAGKSARWR